MNQWIYFLVGVFLSFPSHAFLGDMNFLYLPSDFVSQRADYCRIYFPEQAPTYQTANNAWLMRNKANETTLQEVLRDSGCKGGDCAIDAASTEARADILKARAQKSLKQDMLLLAKADEKKAAALCKETLEIMEGDTLDLAGLAKTFQRKESR